MIGTIQVKVCGLTSAADAAAAAEIGADYLGFVLHEKSPRHIPLHRFGEIEAGLAGRPRVAVVVEPGPGTLGRLRDAGFDRFQVHFRRDMPITSIEGWSKEVGAEALWLAPKLPGAEDVDSSWLALASAVLLDTFDPTLFGGTGRTGDWTKFRRHSEGKPGKTWILSGGLSPENVGAAIAATGTRFVDVNSGVESSPGVKDHGRLKGFAAAVRAAA
ncbi:MAG TPA: phosphoribosylanthranilate isomerase [Opitutaceae bacterium]|jgi:phosphoribosylanthranilate isomerase